jgi:hypothetical protein
MSLAGGPTAQPLSLEPIAEGRQIEGVDDGKWYQLAVRAMGEKYHA